MINSMTAFSRYQAHHPWGQLTWEIRSVNHRYLEPGLKLPELARACEPELRQRLRQSISRGKIDIFLRLHLQSAGADSLALNQPMLDAIVRATDTVRGKLDKAAKISPLELLSWPGVIQQQTDELDPILPALLAGFDLALAELSEARRREGGALKEFILQRLAGLQNQLDAVKQELPDIMSQQRLRLHNKLAELRTELDQSRLEQELVYLAQKVDVDEELDRLGAHVEEIQRVLDQGGACGRRLDFLMQELNREANTLASKSIASFTTLAAVEMKVLIEQMREQVQNIE
jgi:uncharacterized protein (TIGR00255 family)